MAMDSVISGGCIISGGVVRDSVLSPDVRVNSFSEVDMTGAAIEALVAAGPPAEEPQKPAPQEARPAAASAKHESKGDGKGKSRSHGHGGGATKPAAGGKPPAAGVPVLD